MPIAWCMACCAARLMPGAHLRSAAAATASKIVTISACISGRANASAMAGRCGASRLMASKSPLTQSLPTWPRAPPKRHSTASGEALASPCARRYICSKSMFRNGDALDSFASAGAGGACLRQCLEVE